MPQKSPVPPEMWRTLRAEWETSPKMTHVDVAVRLGISSQAVGHRAKKEKWKKYAIQDLDHVSYSPRQIAEIAIRSLVRAATQTEDIPSAVHAAEVLLDRTMGRVAAEQTQPLLPADLVAEPQQWPEWLTQRRLAYQEHGATPDDGFEPPADLALSSQEPRTALDPPHPTCPPAQALPESPRLRLIEPPAPSFYDGPGVPASGPYRGS